MVCWDVSSDTFLAGVCMIVPVTIVRYSKCDVDEFEMLCW
jgi:hypothetical protein